MARKALIVKTERVQKRVRDAIKQGKAPKFPTRAYNRCKSCGRVGGYIRKYEICRICFRERASWAELVGVRKASW